MSNFKVGIFVKCIDNHGCTSELTINKSYKVFEEYSDNYINYITISDDRNNCRKYWSTRFKSIIDQPETKPEVIFEVGKRYFNTKAIIVVDCKYVGNNFVVFSDFSGREFGFDFKNDRESYVEHKEKIVRYVNVYNHDGMYQTRAEADEAAGDLVRRACLKIEGVEGQFDG